MDSVTHCDLSCEAYPEELFAGCVSKKSNLSNVSCEGAVAQLVERRHSNCAVAAGSSSRPGDCNKTIAFLFTSPLLPLLEVEKSALKCDVAKISISGIP